MQKLNLHVKLVYCIPLYKLRTIQIFSIKTYKYFLISVKTGRYYYVFRNVYIYNELRDYSCHAPVLHSDSTHLASVEEYMPLYSASFT